MNSALSRPSLIKLNEKQIKTPIHNSKNKINFGHNLHAGCTIISQSDHAAASRMRQTGIDLSFRLRSFRKGSHQSDDTIGRLWSMHYPAHFKFTNATSTSQYMIELAPAYAGFKHGIVDRAALASLAAVSQSFNLRAPTETLPGDTRASISRLLAIPIDATRLCCRIAVLYTAAAIAEATSSGLRLATLADSATPRTIATFSDWATALEAATRRGEQPVYIGTKSLDEPEIYSRIARILALPSPTFTTGDLEAPPSLVAMWPEIPAARAYIFAATDTYGPLTGIVASRDVALYAEYFGRLYGLQDEIADWIQFAMGFATRPAGSGALGTHSNTILSLPASSMQAMVLSPVAQATDFIGREEPSAAMLFPANAMLAGCMRAAVYLAAFNVTMQAAGGYWLDQNIPASARLSLRYRQVIEPGLTGSAAANATLAMAAELGWDAAYSAPWLAVATNGHPCRTLMPIEIEECIPFISALPSNSALLAILKPVALDEIHPPNQLLTPSCVKGRQSTTDAYYSVVGQHFKAKLHNVSYSRLSQTFKLTDSRIRLSYRGKPSDGQFSDFATELDQHSVGFIFPTTDAVIESYMQHKKSEGVEWFYEWNLPHTDTAVYKQFIVDSYSPPHSEADSTPKEPMVEVPKPPSVQQSPLPPTAMRDLTQLRDLLGADYGAVLDAHSAMAASAGKQLPQATYEANSRTLTGLLTALQIDMIPFFLEDDPSTLRTFMHWFSNACEDAREWDYRPTSKDQLIQQKALATTILEATPMLSAPPTPPLPPTQQAVTALASQAPFTLAQPDIAVETAAIEHAATGESDRTSRPGDQQDFPLTPVLPDQTPVVGAVASTSAMPAVAAGFTAPPAS